jgi:hypothetical protein
MRVLRAGLFVLLLISVANGNAAVLLDQEQSTITLGTSGEGFLVGGVQQYELAQTVTAGIDGRLVRVDFPVVCESGRLEVEIRELTEGEIPGSLVPGTTILARGGADASAFPADGGFVFRPIDVRPPVAMNAGRQFAITLRNETGRCGVGMGLDTDLYAGGASWWRYSGTPADVWLGTGGFADPVDTAFRTWVDSSPAHSAGFAPCSVAGFGSVPIPSFVPLCRCVRDASLREMRCGFMHPDLYLIRTWPDPLPAGKPFEVRWTLLAAKPLIGTIEVDDLYPPGFGDAKEPLVFFGSQVPPGEAITLAYTAVAPAKAATFPVSTEVTIAGTQKNGVDGTIRTRVEVERP